MHTEHRLLTSNCPCRPPVYPSQLTAISSWMLMLGDTPYLCGLFQGTSWLWCIEPSTIAPSSVLTVCRMNESVGIVHDYVKSLLLSQKVFDLRKQQMFSYPSLSRVSFMDLNTHSCKTPLYTHTVQNNKWSTVYMYLLSTPPLHPQETERSKSPFVMNSSLLAFSCFLFLESSGWFLWSTQLTLSLPSFPFIHFFTHWSIIHRYLLNTVHWAQLIPGVTSAKPSVSSWMELTECCITGLRNTTQPLLVDRSDINPRVCLLLAPRGQIWRVKREGVPGGFTPQASLCIDLPSSLPPTGWTCARCCSALLLWGCFGQSSAALVLQGHEPPWPWCQPPPCGHALGVFPSVLRPAGPTSPQWTCLDTQVFMPS